MKKNKRMNQGFTLVELIVVLVILAILAALLIPALTGYIDKAKDKRLLAEARAVLVAAQTIASEEYGDGKSGDAIVAKIKADATKLAEVDGGLAKEVLVTNGKIMAMTYKNYGKQIQYTSDKDLPPWGEIRDIK
ncbi:MAG: prepilin-type N-terminal cleavage/methylation domain-containing protein [Lachnospiraceae bacterium]